MTLPSKVEAYRNINNSETMADIVERYVNNEKYNVQFQVKDTNASEKSPRFRKEKRQLMVAKLPVVMFTEKVQ